MTQEVSLMEQIRALLPGRKTTLSGISIDTTTLDEFTVIIVPKVLEQESHDKVTKKPNGKHYIGLKGVENIEEDGVWVAVKYGFKNKAQEKAKKVVDNASNEELLAMLKEINAKLAG